jgi:hypothetical protein
MPIPKTEGELAELFKQLGASSPESWARSEVREGIPQLLRFLFLKQAWEGIIGDGETQWIQKAIERSQKNPTAPYSGLGQSLQRMVDKGVSLEDISEVVRCMQADTLFSIAYLMDGPAHTAHESLTDVSWGLFETDEDERPIGPQIGGLHESVLEMDPTGREMRARDVSK